MRESLMLKLASALADWHIRRAEFWHEVAQSRFTGKSRAEIRERRLREGDGATTRPPTGFKPRLVEIGLKVKK